MITSIKDGLVALLVKMAFSKSSLLMKTVRVMTKVLLYICFPNVACNNHVLLMKTFFVNFCKTYCVCSRNCMHAVNIRHV